MMVIITLMKAVEVITKKAMLKISITVVETVTQVRNNSGMGIQVTVMDTSNKMVAANSLGKRITKTAMETVAVVVDINKMVEVNNNIPKSHLEVETITMGAGVALPGKTRINSKPKVVDLEVVDRMATEVVVVSKNHGNHSTRSLDSVDKEMDMVNSNHHLHMAVVVTKTTIITIITLRSNRTIIMEDISRNRD